jgi:hypothetical protein
MTDPFTPADLKADRVTVTDIQSHNVRPSQSISNQPCQDGNEKHARHGNRGR